MISVILNLKHFIIYCYISSPNESKRPRTLSKLSDTSVWERRKTKGKVAIQKMVVDLMELYLHRLKQRRPPYPKSPAMAEFVAQFPYEPTPDQRQVVLQSFLFTSFVNLTKEIQIRFSFFLISNKVKLGFQYFLFLFGSYFNTPFLSRLMYI